MKNRKIYGVLMIVLLYIVVLYYYRNAGFTSVGDDEIYRTSIETWGSWFNWAKAYYIGNSGRIVIHSLLIAILNLPVIVFRVVSAAMVTFTYWGIYRIVNISNETKSFWKLLITCMIFLITFFSINTLGGIIRWASGALNYLYPVCAMIIVLIPFVMSINNVNIPLSYKIISMVAVLLCGNMEQSSAVIMVMGLLILGYIKVVKKNHNKTDIIFLSVIWLINTIVFLFSYMAPGVQKRYTAELIRCCGFGMFSLSQKLVLGMQIFTLS